MEPTVKGDETRDDVQVQLPQKFLPLLHWERIDESLLGRRAVGILSIVLGVNGWGSFVVVEGLGCAVIGHSILHDEDYLKCVKCSIDRLCRGETADVMCQRTFGTITWVEERLMPLYT